MHTEHGWVYPLLQGGEEPGCPLHFLSNTEGGMFFFLQLSTPTPARNAAHLVQIIIDSRMISGTRPLLLAVLVGNSDSLHG